MLLTILQVLTVIVLLLGAGASSLVVHTKFEARSALFCFLLSVVVSTAIGLLVMPALAFWGRVI